MSNIIYKLPIKLRIFLSGLFSILIAVSILTLYNVNKYKEIKKDSVIRQLDLQVGTVKKMFEREYALKLSKVSNDLKVVSHSFYQSKLVIDSEEIEIEVVNQITGRSHITRIKNWKLNGSPLLYDRKFISKMHSMMGGTTSIFQKIDSGYVRISTNVRTSEGTPATATYIPNSSEVIKTIERFRKYYGRAYVVNDWYITAYEPIVCDNEVVGILYSGDKEKDMQELQRKLEGIKVGLSGFLWVIDSSDNTLFSSDENLSAPMKNYILETIESEKERNYIVPKQISSQKGMFTFTYYEQFGIFIIGGVFLSIESKDIIRGLIRNSLLFALIIVLVLSVFIYYLTAENLQSFISKLDSASKDMNVVQQALLESRHDFQTLFNSTSDDIIVSDYAGTILEVNKVCCETFKKSKDEMLHMKIGDLLTEKSREHIKENLNKVIQFGKHTFEAEYQLAERKTLYVEIKSKIIELYSKPMIMNLIRDISLRKEMEEKMIATIIQTEENERKRFSADLHDDLGPILSTIKLYAGLLKKNEQKQISNQETIKNIEELSDNAIQTTRNISRNIRPSILQDFGLAAAIKEFCSYVIKTKSIKINLNIQNYKIEKRGIEETILYHTTKELINNTMRYANASNIKIDLKSYQDQIIYYYRDDGIGFDMELMKKVPKGLGLNNIINKIRSIKGTVDMHSEEGKGMFLIASVNISANK